MGMRKPEDDQDIWVIDTSSLQITKTIYSVAADLRALSVSSDGTELYVAATDGDTVPTQNDPMAKPFVHQAIRSLLLLLRRFRSGAAPGRSIPAKLGDDEAVCESGRCAVIRIDALAVCRGSDEVVALDRATPAEKVSRQSRIGSATAFTLRSTVVRWQFTVSRASMS